MAGIIQKSARRFITQIGAAGVPDAIATTIPLVSTSGLPTDTEVEIIVDRTDSGNNFTPLKEEVIRGTVSGNNLINCTRGVEGTAQAHSAGAVVNQILTSSMWNEFSQYVRDVGLVMYPVGSIYTSVVNTNPNTFFGGTWVSFATGRTIVGIDTGQTEFDTIEKTGGAKTHTLTTNEMPSHTHTQNAHNHTQDSHNHTQNSHNHTQNAHNHQSPNLNNFVERRGSAGGSFSTPDGAFHYFDSTSNTSRNTTATNQATTATNQATTATNQATTATNQNTGGGAAHNNLQPYITVYMWKRTA
jgi:microcystin-dependent protein